MTVVGQKRRKSLLNWYILKHRERQTESESDR